MTCSASEAEGLGLRVLGFRPSKGSMCLYSVRQEFFGSIGILGKKLETTIGLDLVSGKDFILGIWNKVRASISCCLFRVGRSFKGFHGSTSVVF